MPKENVEWFKNFVKANYDEQLYSTEAFDSDHSFESDSEAKTLVN